MHYPNITALIADRKNTLAKGPIALILAEDDVLVESTLQHHIKLGFKSVILLADGDLKLPSLTDDIHRVDCDVTAENILTSSVNQIIPAIPDIWLYYGYNAEYLHYPFCETRSIGEAVRFQMEERRDAVMCFVVDLYAQDLIKHPTAVSVENAHLDGSGYYALTREDDAYNPLDRQLDFHGGLRWRFEEHIPPARRRIDRIAMFKALSGLTLRPDFTFNAIEYNTYACPWHNNMTMAVCSFRTAKALKRNPGSRDEITSFHWHGSVPFGWHSQQLMDLGLIEPGQWF